MNLKITEDIAKQAHELYKKGISPKEISYTLQVNHSSLIRSFHRYNLELNKVGSHSICTQQTILTNKEHEILEGCLLGDGCLHLESKTPSFSYKSIFPEVEQTLKLLLPYKSLLSIRKAKTALIQNRSCNCKAQYTYRVNCDLSLLSYEKRWYNNRVKRVPSDIQLSPTTVKWWFYGDGSTSKVGNKITLTLCTDSFSYSDIKLLQEKFRLLGIGIGVQNVNGYKRLQVANKESVTSFFNYIGACDLPCFAYKWKSYEVRKLGRPKS